MLRRLVVVAGLMVVTAGSAQAQYSVGVSATILERVDVQPELALQPTAAGVRILDVSADQKDSQLLEQTFVSRGAESTGAHGADAVRTTAVTGAAALQRAVPELGLDVKLVGDARSVTVTRVVASNS